MDRQRALKLAAVALACTTLAAAAQPSQILRQQGWTVQGETLAFDLTHAPSECLARTSPEIEAGRALFRSPALLGGPAARLGLSCDACHSNGRANARFFLPELTNRAGAADVTSEWSSRVRGDGVTNPVPIPDLAGVGAKAGFGAARNPSLSHFVRGVIEEEFQGAPPPDEALASVIAYLNALDASACAPDPAPISLTLTANDVRRAIDAARGAEPATASLLVLSAQDAIGRIVERLPAQRFATSRNALEGLARELGGWRSSGDVRVALLTGHDGWRARFDAAIARISRRERHTYFDAETLRRHLSH